MEDGFNTQQRSPSDQNTYTKDHENNSVQDVPILSLTNKHGNSSIFQESGLAPLESATKLKKQFALETNPTPGIESRGEMSKGQAFKKKIVMPKFKNSAGLFVNSDRKELIGQGSP